MDPDLRDLLAAWHGQEDVDPGRRERLLDRLRADEAFRRAFVDEVWMLGMLKEVQAAEPRWLRLEDELGWSAAMDDEAAGLEDRVIDRLGEPKRHPPTARRRIAWAAAALVPIAAGLLLASWRSGGGGERGEGGRAADRPYPRIDPADGLAMVVRLDGVRWEPGGGPHPAEGDVVAGDRLRISSGRMNLSMLTGVTLAVEGPADLELVADDRVVCRRGRLRVRSPEGLGGFVVAGPNSAVVDLGTEFGMNVGADGEARARVFEGSVDSAVTGDDGTPRRTRLFREREAFRIDPRAGQIEPVGDGDDFLGPSDPAVPPLALGDGYAGSVLEARPWGYWRFEAIEAGAVANEVEGRPPLRVVGPVRLAEGPGGNRSLEFPAEPARRNLELDGQWEPPWRSGFAVELWALTEQIGHSTLVSMAASNDTNNHLFLLELTARNLLHRPASVRFLHRWPPGGTGGDNLYSRGPYVPYRWHHIVAQYRGDRIELYVNGAPEPPLTVDPGHEAGACRLLVGRLTARPGTGISYDRPLVGRMDELALYDRPLGPEEIRAHHRLGSARPAPR